MKIFGRELFRWGWKHDDYYRGVHPEEDDSPLFRYVFYVFLALAVLGFLGHRAGLLP